MYIDFKISLWERIKIPHEIEDEFKNKVLTGQIKSPVDAFIHFGDKLNPDYEKLIDTVQMVKLKNNDGEATIQLFDKRHNLVYSNDTNLNESVLDLENIDEQL